MLEAVAGHAGYTHAVTAQSAGSCLHHEGTFLNHFPSAVQEGSAHAFLQTSSAPSWHPAIAAAH